MKEQVVNIEAALAQLAKDEENLGKQPEGEGDPPLTQEQISERRNELTAQKGEIEAKLAGEAEENLEVKYPAAVKEENKVNIVIIGPREVRQNHSRQLLGPGAPALRHQARLTSELVQEPWLSTR